MSKFYINTAPKSTSIFIENELPKDTAICLEPRLKKIHDSVDFEELRNIIEESVNSYNNSSLAKSYSSSTSTSTSTSIEQNNELCELIPSSDSTKNLSYSRPYAGRKGFDPVLMFVSFQDTRMAICQLKTSLTRKVALITASVLLDRLLQLQTSVCVLI